MIDLKVFKNCHVGEDIYILASGKSVDFIDKSFFKNKIIIGVNQAYKKCVCKYLLRKEAKYMNEVINANDKKTIHFVSEGDCGSTDTQNKKNTQNALNKVDTSNVVLYPHNKNMSATPITSLPQDDMLIVSFSTITTAIHLAAYMGAKNIILVGHDCGTINGECNFEGYHNNETYKVAHTKGKEGYVLWLKMIENNTIQLKKLLIEKYGCNIYSLNPFINFNLEGNVYKK